MSRVRFGLFSLDVDENWTLSTVILAGPQEAPFEDPRMMSAAPPRPFQQNLIVTMEQVSAEETPRSYVDRQIDGLRQAGVRRLEGASPEKVELADGGEGLLLEQVILGAGGERVRQMQLVRIKEGLAYTAIASHLDGEPFDRVRKNFKNMLLSFQ